nr:pleiotropic drug resistance protein 3 [Quercus suber]
MHVMQEFVNEVLETIEVDGIKNALVGINGLSNEQRKRLTINSRGPVELVANPSIIFMVEPTTGLDTRAAAIIVMRAVKNVAGTGRTIEAFDEVLDGSVCYAHKRENNLDLGYNHFLFACT